MPSCLYHCSVTHRRLFPKKLAFHYRLFNLWLDVDELAGDATGLRRQRWPRLLRFERWGIFGFYRGDHGPRNGSDLRAWVTGLLAHEASPFRDGQASLGKIYLFCMPRYLGYVFNPLSIFCCYDTQDRLRVVIYQVKNTFGEQYSYLFPVEIPAKDTTRSKPIRHGGAKNFHVSPFMEVEGTYDFILHPPHEKFDLVINYRVPQDGQLKLILVARQWGQRTPFTNWQLLRSFVAYPMMTIKVIVAIHWQALRLWLKRVAHYRKPPPPTEEFHWHEE